MRTLLRDRGTRLNPRVVSTAIDQAVANLGAMLKKLVLLVAFGGLMAFAAKKTMLRKTA